MVLYLRVGHLCNAQCFDNDGIIIVARDSFCIYLWSIPLFLTSWHRRCYSCMILYNFRIRMMALLIRYNALYLSIIFVIYTYTCYTYVIRVHRVQLIAMQITYWLHARYKQFWKAFVNFCQDKKIGYIYQLIIVSA